MGLDYYVARFYDPLTTHFTRADTLIPGPGKASSFDRYAYVQNNPVRYNDPSGHDVGCAGSDASNCKGVNHLIDRDLGYKTKPLSYLETQELVKSPYSPYMQGWTNFGTAWYIYTNTNATLIDRYMSGLYLGAWAGVHISLAAGVAGLVCVAAGPACVGAVEGALGIGSVISADGDPTNEIQVINTGSYSVYQYVQNGVIKYYGMTNDFARRAGEHLSSRGWKIEPIEGLFKNLSYYDARSVEQALIEQAGLQNLNNIVNSIAKSNSNYPLAIQNGNNILKMLGILH